MENLKKALSSERLVLLGPFAQEYQVIMSL